MSCHFLTSYSFLLYCMVLFVFVAMIIWKDMFEHRSCLLSIGSIMWHLYYRNDFSACAMFRCVSESGHMIFSYYIIQSCLMGVWLISDSSFESSPRHDRYLPKFEAELAQRCEKLVASILHCFLIVCYGWPSVNSFSVIIPFSFFLGHGFG